MKQSRKWVFRLNPEESHPWVIECKTNIPGIWNEVSKVRHKPMAELLCQAPNLLKLCQIMEENAPSWLGTPEDAKFLKRLRNTLAKLKKESV